jgi:N,N'-diacetylchitobiose phosphorylase
VRLSFDGMIVDPCIPAGWREFSVIRQWRGATFEITVKNPDGVQNGVIATTLNGEAVQGPIEAQPAGSVNKVLVVMG